MASGFAVLSRHIVPDCTIYKKEYGNTIHSFPLHLLSGAHGGVHQ